MANPDVEVEMEFGKETKRTVKFEENPGPNPEVMGSAYVKKHQLPTDEDDNIVIPEKIHVSAEFEGEVEEAEAGQGS